ncbi:MAG TPA: phosphosulfolactate synthase [Candidatus Dormibacteraeota bacterium]|jgi:phosphosulfolactate synthase|nr:phosphosulfolactate synthase [Candidatus Dormibacteraeota bacterium]
MSRPDFLELPARAAKPRRTGVTHVLDRGLPLAEVRGLLGICAEHVDIWKLGWGTAYLDPQVADRVAILDEHGVAACVGGTLLEVAWVQGAAERLLDWAAEAGFPCVEVSNGTQRLPLLEKRRLIERAAARFTVLAEVGAKEPDAPVHAYTWAEEAAGDLEAGATWVVAEGRESGTVGLYSPDGTVRAELVDALLRATHHRVIFEAPRRDQQAWFIRRLGSDAGIGNVVPAEVLGLEALRLGLRADTVELSCGDGEVSAAAGT